MKALIAPVYYWYNIEMCLTIAGSSAEGLVAFTTPATSNFYVDQNRSKDEAGKCYLLPKVHWIDTADLLVEMYRS